MRAVGPTLGDLLSNAQNKGASCAGNGPSKTTHGRDLEIFLHDLPERVCVSMFVCVGACAVVCVGVWKRFFGAYGTAGVQCYRI